MPGLVTMKSKGSGIVRAMARAKEERGLGALLSQVRVSPAKKGRRPTDLLALGELDRSNFAMRLRLKLVGEGGDEEASGNEHVSSAPEPEPSSVCLAAMVDEFLEDESGDGKDGRLQFNFDDGSSAGDEDAKSSFREDLFAVLHRSANSFPERILVDEMNRTIAAVNVSKYVGDDVKDYLNRHIVRRLLRVGHNAGICTSRWDHSGGFPSGGYEYIDVLFEGLSGRWERIVVDIDFRAQFEIARPTAQYNALAQALPPVFVGRPDQLQLIVSLMSDAVKLSLKKRGMYLPPWRKPEYMRAKWFSSYKRTIIDIWEKYGDEVSGRSNEASDVSLVANAGEKCSDRLSGLENPDEKFVMEESIVKNKIVFGERSQEIVGDAVRLFDNNDWHLPVLKAKRSQGPGHAGLASLFKEAGPKSSMGKDQLVKVM